MKKTIRKVEITWESHTRTIVETIRIERFAGSSPDCDECSPFPDLINGLVHVEPASEEEKNAA